MPVLTAWTAALGTSQGCVEPTNVPAFDGARVFVLGDDRPGVTRRLAVGDFIEVEQLGDVTGVRFVRWRAHVRAAELMPGDLAWALRLTLDGAPLVEHVLYREVDLLDVAVPIGAATGDHRVSARLVLTGSPGTAEVELPGVYLDGVALDSVATGLVLCNRDPGPGETGVPVDRAIRLDVIDAAGATPVSSALVHVDGVLAYSGGVFQPGFDGPDSADDPTIAGGFGLRIVIDPTSLYSSEAPVSVRVDVGLDLNETYSFTAEDVFAPSVVDVRAIERRVVRVTFSEDVRQDDPGAANDALNPDNYAVEVASTSLLDGLPAAAVAVESVEVETSRSVLLRTEQEPTPGAIYRLTVSGVEDLAGNVVA